MSKIPTKFPRTKLTIAFLSLALFTFQPALSFAQLEFRADISVENIANPLRQEQAGPDEFLTSVTAEVQLDRQTKWFDSQFSYSINRQEYDRDILNDQSLVDGAGSLVWNILPERFQWALSNTRSNQLIDISQPDVMDNRQVVDYTSTGPTWLVPLDRASYLNMSAQFGVVEFGEFDVLKHSRNRVDASYMRKIGQRFTLSVQSSFTDADYSEAEFLSYNLSSIHTQLSFEIEDLNIATQLGVQSIKRGNFSTDSPIRRLDILYKLNSRLALTLAYAESVEDLLSDLTTPSAVDQSFVNTDIELDGNFGSTNTGNIYQSVEQSVGITYTIPSSYSFGLRYANFTRQNIQQSIGDDDKRILANFSMPFGNRTTVRASIEHSKQFLAFDQSRLRRVGYRLAINYRINDRLSLTFSGTDTNQKNSDAIDPVLGETIALGLSFTR